MKKSLISVAPMMDCTDRHYRYFARLLTRHSLLYTEMITSGAIIHGDREKLLGYDAFEHPLAIQLGGSNPCELAQAAKISEHYGYAQINLNVGCPSDRVQAGRFGACLMKEPQLVADCVSAMRAAVTIPVTVKTRIGVDEDDSYEQLMNFVKLVAQAGCRTFIIHARKAWLKGLSPRENREVPPLRYEVVYQLKRDFPSLEIVINGGIKTVADIHAHLECVDGAMIGREAYANPWLLTDFDKLITGECLQPPEIQSVIAAYLPYVAKQLAAGVRLRALTRHLMGLFRGQPRGKHWRRYLSENSGFDERGVDVIRAALRVQAAIDDCQPLNSLL